MSKTWAHVAVLTLSNGPAFATPAPHSVTENFTRLITALEARTPLSGPSCRRLLHGRGGTFPGLDHLTLDWYPPYLHLICYKPIEDEIPRLLGQWLAKRLSPVPEGLIVQHRYRPGAPQAVAWGAETATPLAREDGLCFALNFNKGQNIGFFPDMGCGRAYLRRNAKGLRILNLFAYTCTLSVAALAGGAEEVINLDMSSNSLAWGQHNHALNDIDQRRVSFLAHDLYKSFSKLRRLGPFDLVIADPPDTQGKSFIPERDWPRLLRRLPELLKPGGELLAGMAVPRLGRSFLETTVAAHAPTCQLIGELQPGADFAEKEPDRGLHLLRYRFTVSHD